MKKVMVLSLSLMVFLIFSNIVQSAPKLKEDFEKKDLGEGWEIEGDAAVSQEKAHAGKGSLKIPMKSTVSFTFAEENKSAVVTMWVLDPGTQNKPDLRGAKWGVKNADDDKFCMELVWYSYLDGNLGYGYVCTADNAWFDNCWSNIKRNKEWCKWIFDFSSDDARMVTADEQTSLLEIERVFKGGITGIFLMGGDNEKAGDFYIDDIEIKVTSGGKK